MGAGIIVAGAGALAFLGERHTGKPGSPAEAGQASAAVRALALGSNANLVRAPGGSAAALASTASTRALTTDLYRQGARSIPPAVAAVHAALVRRIGPSAAGTIDAFATRVANADASMRARVDTGIAVLRRLAPYGVPGGDVGAFVRGNIANHARAEAIAQAARNGDSLRALADGVGASGATREFAQQALQGIPLPGMSPSAASAIVGGVCGMGEEAAVALAGSGARYAVRYGSTFCALDSFLGLTGILGLASDVEAAITNPSRAAQLLTSAAGAVGGEIVDAAGWAGSKGKKFVSAVGGAARSAYDNTIGRIPGL